MIEVRNYIEPIEESIKNTTPGKAYVSANNSWLDQYEWGVSTDSSNGQYVYLHVVTPPNGKTLSIGEPEDDSVFLKNGTLLNTNQPVTVTKTDTGYDITLQPDDNWDSVNTVIRLEREGNFETPSPSPSPSVTPSASPSVSPSTEPSSSPSSSPSASPSTLPSSTPTFIPGGSVNPPYFPSATPKPTVSPEVSPEPSISPEPSVSPSTVPEESKFEDIENHWAKKEITALAADGIIKGITETEFAPDQTVTRAEFAALIVRALELDGADLANEFSDVQSGDWYAADVAAINQAGIMTGDETGKFRPNDEITREEMAKVLVNAYQIKTGETVTGEGAVSGFNDSGLISEWAKEYVDAAVSLNLLSGYEDNTIRPQDITTRAQAATVIYRLLYS